MYNEANMTELNNLHDKKVKSSGEDLAYGIILSIARLIAGVMLLVALGNWPSWYFENLRIVVFIVSALLVTHTLRSKSYIWVWYFIGLLILFNPFYQIVLQKEIWRIIDIIAAISFFASFSVRLEGRTQDKQGVKNNSGIMAVSIKIIKPIQSYFHLFIKNIRYVVASVVIAILLCFAIFWFIAPEANTVESTSGAKLVISGRALSFAKVLIYSNDEYVTSVNVDSSGKFSKEIAYKDEGKKSIKMKQSFLVLNSSFSKSIETTIDLTPPNKDTFSLTSQIPENTNSSSIVVEAKINPKDILRINDSEYTSDSNGKVSASVNLSDGNNSLKFRLIDAYKNTSEIVLEKNVNLDSSKLSFSDRNGCFSLFSGASPRQVCLAIGDWTGTMNSYTSTPIVGEVGAKIKSVLVDGKNITWDANRDVYQRISLLIYGGLNKYPVVVTDIDGNTMTGYISTTSELSR